MKAVIKTLTVATLLSSGIASADTCTSFSANETAAVQEAIEKNHEIYLEGKTGLEKLKKESLKIVRGKVLGMVKSSKASLSNSDKKIDLNRILIKETESAQELLRLGHSLKSCKASADLDDRVSMLNPAYPVEFLKAKYKKERQKHQTSYEASFNQIFKTEDLLNARKECREEVAQILESLLSSALEKRNLRLNDRKDVHLFQQIYDTNGGDKIEFEANSALLNVAGSDSEALLRMNFSLFHRVENKVSRTEVPAQYDSIGNLISDKKIIEKTKSVVSVWLDGSDSTPMFMYFQKAPGLVNYFTEREIVKDIHEDKLDCDSISDYYEQIDCRGEKLTRRQLKCSRTFESVQEFSAEK